MFVGGSRIIRARPLRYTMIKIKRNTCYPAPQFESCLENIDIIDVHSYIYITFKFYLLHFNFGRTMRQI